jgi:ribonuclease HI
VGGCGVTPGRGGGGALIRIDGDECCLSGATPDTTNNRMELMAAIEGLAYFSQPSTISLTTDSQYVRQGITQWITGWKRNGWRTSNKQPVKNQDLWQQLDALAEKHAVSWFWVKGHSGHVENERADQLANEAIDQMTAVS